MTIDGNASTCPRPQKTCVTSTGTSSGDPVDPRFGRCAYFIISDGPGADLKAFENTARGLGNGAGIQAAQSIANMGVAVVLTGDLGPNAFRVLAAAGIRAFRTRGGTVAEALSDFSAHKLEEMRAPTGPGHHGGGGRGPRWQDQRGP